MIQKFFYLFYYFLVAFFVLLFLIHFQFQKLIFDLFSHVQSSSTCLFVCLFSSFTRVFFSRCCDIFCIFQTIILFTIQRPLWCCVVQWLLPYLNGEGYVDLCSFLFCLTQVCIILDLRPFNDFFLFVAEFFLFFCVLIFAFTFPWPLFKDMLFRVVTYFMPLQLVAWSANI